MVAAFKMWLKKKVILLYAVSVIAFLDMWEIKRGTESAQ